MIDGLYLAVLYTHDHLCMSWRDDAIAAYFAEPQTPTFSAALSLVDPLYGQLIPLLQTLDRAKLSKREMSLAIIGAARLHAASLTGDNLVIPSVTKEVSTHGTTPTN